MLKIKAQVFQHKATFMRSILSRDKGWFSSENLCVSTPG